MSRSDDRAGKVEWDFTAHTFTPSEVSAFRCRFCHATEDKAIHSRAWNHRNGFEFIAYPTEVSEGRSHAQTVEDARSASTQAALDD